MNGSYRNKKRINRSLARRRKATLGTVALIFIVVIILIIVKLCSEKDTTPYLPTDVEETAVSVLSKIDESVFPKDIDANINSRFALVFDRSDNSVICQRNGFARAYPASLTKIMTALVAIENIKDTSLTISISDEILDEMYIESASTTGFERGEVITIKDLLYGVILPSGGDACVALAEYISGSEEAFVKLMNKKAGELKLTGTHFSNSTGLHDAENYTTAYDLAKLLNAALENDTFYKIFTAKAYTATATTYHTTGLTFSSTMFNYFTQNNVDIGNIIGGKTGFTPEAGVCLASLSVKNGKGCICITMGGGSGDAVTAFHVYDARTLFDTYT